ncbi:MAG: NAD(P)-binding protein [Limnobacter sp.]|nr:NAD(P)-binding protein [Limnobacter sp.]
MKHHVAVVGAGLSGLACARALAQAGVAVTVFEKSRGTGGRAPTRWVDRETTPPVGFDHGTQYFTAQSYDFLAQVLAVERAGAVAPWAGRVVNLSYGVITEHEITEHETGEPAVAASKWVGVPGMASFCKHLALGLDVQVQSRVLGLAHGPQGWALDVQVGQAPLAETSVAGFTHVVLAIPAEQASVLLKHTDPEMAATAANVVSGITWTALVGLAKKTGTAFDAAFVADSPLGWVARDSSKPGRAPGERWVVHATADWSKIHENSPKDQVAQQLFDLFANAIHTVQKPDFLSAHRWLYSLPRNPLGVDFLLSKSLPLSACGDWLSAPNLESAYLGGHRLGKHLVAQWCLPG